MKLTLTGLFLLLVLALLPGAALAQDSTPAFAELTVELWPEFDQPEVLVIYRARLSSDTPLPAVVTLNFPPHIETMNAIAAERNGGLFTIEDDAVVINKTGNALEITLSVDNPAFQLEYYDPQLLQKQGDRRQIDFTLQVDYPVAITRVQVQQPLEATDFTILPEGSGSFTDQNGMYYEAVEAAGLAAGDLLPISASYNRSTDELSKDLFPASGDIQVITGDTPANRQPPWGYLLIGVGLLVLLATGGYWWSKRAAARPTPPSRTPSPRPVPPQQRPAPRPSQTARRKPAAGGYCHQCGTALRDDSNFCHVCGAERRHD